MIENQRAGRDVSHHSIVGSELVIAFPYYTRLSCGPVSAVGAAREGMGGAGAAHCPPRSGAASRAERGQTTTAAVGVAVGPVLPGRCRACSRRERRTCRGITASPSPPPTGRLATAALRAGGSRHTGRRAAGGWRQRPPGSTVLWCACSAWSLATSGPSADCRGGAAGGAHCREDGQKTASCQRASPIRVGHCAPAADTPPMPVPWGGLARAPKLCASPRPGARLPAPCRARLSSGPGARDAGEQPPLAPGRTPGGVDRRRSWPPPCPGPPPVPAPGMPRWPPASRGGPWDAPRACRGGAGGHPGGRRDAGAPAGDPRAPLGWAHRPAAAGAVQPAVGGRGALHVAPPHRPPSACGSSSPDGAQAWGWQRPPLPPPPAGGVPRPASRGAATSHAPPAGPRPGRGHDGPPASLGAAPPPRGQQKAHARGAQDRRARCVPPRCACGRAPAPPASGLQA